MNNTPSQIETPLWQTEEWERFQHSLGHKTDRVGRGKTLILIYPLFLGLSYGYCPRGPIITSTSNLADFLSGIEKEAKKRKLIFTRVDPEQDLRLTGESVRLSHSTQPETTLVLDLSLSEADLLKQMKRKGRYNISLAEKKGIEVKMAKNEGERKEFVNIFYHLLTETTQRDRFSSHSEEYYQKMLKNVSQSEIMVAFNGSDAIAAGIFTYQKHRVIYYYGASSNANRELMAPYLLQWRAIQEAKIRGCGTYDFLGIAPEDATKNHPWKGITEFKQKFGGSVLQYPQARDIIHRPFWYQFFQFAKTIQKLIRS